MSEPQERIDPVDNYFVPVQRAEKFSNFVFWMAALMSILVLFIDEKATPLMFQMSQIVFVILVIALFAIGIITRLYWFPRAEDQRRLGLFSNATNVPLTHEKTSGFYNNEATEPLKRLGLSSMENCFFTREIASAMLTPERIIISGYLIAFIVAICVRSTELAVIPIAAQAIFSEQLISRWLRLEWLRLRCNSVYEKLHTVFQTSPGAQVRTAHILDAVTTYETSKANAGIALDSRVFRRLNPKLTRDWNAIRATLRP